MAHRTPLPSDITDNVLYRGETKEARVREFLFETNISIVKETDIAFVYARIARFNWILNKCIPL